MQQLSDHPQIARALRTGYPEPEEKPLFLCEDTKGCGAPIYAGDPYYEVDGCILCEDCGPVYLDELYRRTAAPED